MRLLGVGMYVLPAKEHVMRARVDAVAAIDDPAVLSGRFSRGRPADYLAQ